MTRFRHIQDFLSDGVGWSPFGLSMIGYYFALILISKIDLFYGDLERCRQGIWRQIGRGPRLTKYEENLKLYVVEHPM